MGVAGRTRTPYVADVPAAIHGAGAIFVVWDTGGRVHQTVRMTPPMDAG